MTAAPSAGAIETDLQAGQSLVRRVRILAGLTVSAVLFWYVGWGVAGPVDPYGPVSLLSAKNGILAMTEMMGLSIAAAGIAVAVAGPRAAHHGPLAVAVGLAALALRGGEIDMLVMSRLVGRAGDSAPLTAFPLTELVAETWLWIVLISAGFVIGRWVESWFGPEPMPSRPAGAPVDSAGEMRQGVAVTVITALVGYNLLRLTGGQDNDPILAGQVYFAVGISFLLSMMLAQTIFRTTSRIWGLIAVAIVAMAAYSIHGPTASEIEHARAVGAFLTIRTPARPLPIEFAAMGSIGVLAGFSLSRRLRPE